MKNNVIIVVSLLIIFSIFAIVYLANNNIKLEEQINIYEENLKVSENEIHWSYSDLNNLYDYSYELDKNNDDEPDVSTWYSLYLYDNGRYVYTVTDGINSKFIRGHIGNYVIENENNLRLEHLYTINNNKTITKDNENTKLNIEQGNILTFSEDNREIKLMINGMKESAQRYLNNGSESFNHYLNYKVVD